MLMQCSLKKSSYKQKTKTTQQQQECYLYYEWTVETEWILVSIWTKKYSQSILSKFGVKIENGW